MIRPIFGSEKKKKKRERETDYAIKTGYMPPSEMLSLFLFPRTPCCGI